ncbi:MAG: DUF4397 domain-containing protein [Polyangiales bacterium]
MKMNVRASGLVALALAAACSSSTPPPPPPPPPPAPTGGETTEATPPTPPPPPAMAKVRVIHAAPIAEPNVDVYADGAATPAIEGLAFKAVRGYMDLPVGEHTVALRPAGNHDGDPLVSATTPSLEQDHFYTVIAHGVPGGQPALAITASGDDTTEPPEGQARVRFFHALVGVNAVDVCVAGATARAAATPVFANVGYGAWGDYANVPGGNAVNLQVRAQNARPCTGAVIGTVSVTPPAGARATAVAVGNTTATPAVAPELLVCTDTAESSCSPTAITLARRGRR